MAHFTDALDTLTNYAAASDIVKLIAELDEFKGAWRQMSTLAPERLGSLRHVATVESIGSSTRIEGAKLSDRDVEKLLNNLSIESFATRDEQEVAGYAAAMDMVFDNHAEIPITENHIKQLHQVLLRYSEKDERHRGSYKNLPNHVEAYDADGKSLGVIFETGTPFDTPRMMQELVVWTKEMLDDGILHPLVTIGVFVVVFLAIHPLQDGNGRLSRILTTLLLLKAGYAHVPYSSLEKVVEENKDRYYLALRRTQTSLKEGVVDWHSWLRFFLLTLKKQKNRLAEKIEFDDGLKGLTPDDNQIIGHVRKHGRITTADAVELLRLPRPTVKKRLARLVELGQLALHGKGRGAWYGTP